MITDEAAESAVDFLRDSALAVAEARSNRIYADEFRKHLKAILMALTPDQPLGAQERDAYGHEKYLEHIKLMREAILDDERLRAQREAAIMKIEAWRSQSANMRGFKV